MPIMLSPGVKTRELDFSMYASELSTCVVGMVGGASKGPIGIPTFCASPSDFTRLFGEPVDDEDFGAIAALSFLSKGSNLWYVREGNGDEAQAEVTFDGKGSPTGGTAQKETATVAVTTVTAGNINVVVTAPGMINSPKTIVVAVAENDVANDVAGKIRTALIADANVGHATTGFFTVTGATNKVILTAKTAAADDALMNIAIQAANGVTAALESENTTPGVAPSAPDITDILTIKFKEKGTYGERYSFKITNAAVLDFTLTIYDGNFVKEMFNASLDSTSAKFIEDKYSDEFEYTVDIKTAVSISNADKTALSGGDDGLPLANADVVGSGVRGLYAFANPNNVDISILAAPGRDDKTVIQALLSICESRSDCLAIIDPPQGLTPTQMASFHNGTLGETGNPETILNSSYGAIYYPWVKIAHPTTAEAIWAPPSVVVLPAFATNDVVASPWFAPAGLNRGNLPSVSDSEVDLSEDDNDLLYGNDNAVNPIINYRKQGYVIWGQRTLQREDTALDRINVRRLMLYIRKVISASSAYLLFEQNDVGTWDRWKGMVNPFLESVKGGRGVYEYKIVMDSTTVTPAHIDRNEMPGRVFIRPTKTAEFIVIDFVLKSTGASFV